MTSHLKGVTLHTVPGSPQRREGSRVEAAFRVRYPTLDKLVVAYTQDLSKGGLFLRTQRYLPVNAVIRLHLDLPEGGGDVPIISRVAFVRDERDAAASGRPAGMGIEFLDVGREQLGRITAFITERTERETGRLDAETSSGLVELGRPLTVLIVDDEPAYRALAAGPFLARGDTVREAEDGIAGLAACLKEPPDVVLSDVQMPRMDGWQLLRIIRARPTLASIPVVFFTTLAGEEERLKGYQLGVDDYVPKPFRPEELLVRIQRLVARVSRRGRAHAERKSLRGDLEQVTLASVLQFLELERKTGLLLLVSERRARLSMKDGRLVRAQFADAPPLPSMTVLHDVLRSKRGTFEFTLEEVAGPDEIGATVSSLLLEQARLDDEETR